MIRIVKILAGLLVVAVLGVAGLGYYVKMSLQPEALQKLVQDRGSELLGRKVTVGAASLDWTGAAHVEGLKIADQAGTSDQLAVQAADIRFSILGLFSGTYGLSKVSLVAPKLTVTQRGDGSHDLQDVVDKLGKGGSTGSGAMVLPTLGMSQGELTLVGPAGSRTVKGMDLQVWGAGGIVGFKGEAQLDERKAMLEGKIDPSAGTVVLSRGALEGVIPGSRLRLGHGTLAYQGKTRSLRLDQVMIGESRGKVSVDLVDGSALKGEIEFTGVDLVTAHPALKRGRANLKLALGGTVDAPKVEGGGDVQEVLIQKSEGDREIKIDSGKFTFTELQPDPLSLVVSLQDFQASLPGMTPPVVARIEKGRFRIGPSGVFSEGLEMVASGIPMKPKIEIRTEGKDPQLDLDTGAIHVDLGKIGPMLTGAMAESYTRFAPQGEISGGVKVTGTASAPVMAGGIDVKKVSFRMEGRPEPVTVGPGKVRMSGQKIQVDSLGVAMDPVKVDLTGTVEDLFSSPKFVMNVGGKGLELAARGAIVGGSFQNTTVEGQAEAGAFVPGAKVTGPVRIALTVAGTTADPAISGTAEIPSLALRTEGGGVIKVTDMRSPVQGGRAGLSLPQLAGSFYGGKVSGGLELSGAGVPSYDVALERASIAGLMGDVAGTGDLLSGTMGARFKGGGILAKLQGSGEARLEGMVLTVGKNRAMAMLGIGIKAGEEGAGFLASQAGENIIGGLLKSTSSGAGFFKGVIDVLSAPVDMGDLSVPLSAQEGVLTAGRFESQAIAGTVSIDLGKEMALGGRLDHLRLGRVGLSNIGLGGTVGAPIPKIDMKNLLFDGQPAPMGISEVGNILSGKNVGEVVQDQVKQQIEKQTGGLLDGLMGGKRRKPPQGDPAGFAPSGETSVTPEQQPPPQAEPAQPQPPPQAEPAQQEAQPPPQEPPPQEQPPQQEPAAQEPPPQEPAAQEPAAQEPPRQEPVAEDPPAQEPAAPEPPPAQEPAATEPPPATEEPAGDAGAPAEEASPSPAAP